MATKDMATKGMATKGMARNDMARTTMGRITMARMTWAARAVDRTVEFLTCPSALFQNGDKRHYSTSIDLSGYGTKLYQLSNF